MPLIDQIQKDMVAAMKAREEQRLSTLRMVKTALKNREIDKMAPLDDKESQQVLSTLIKQRKDSVEQFTKGGRQEMADKEAAEIKLIETYLPKAAGEEEITAGVRAALAEMTPAPAMKGRSNSLMIFSITSSCSGVPRATTTLRSKSMKYLEPVKRFVIARSSAGRAGVSPLPT